MNKVIRCNHDMPKLRWKLPVDGAIVTVGDFKMLASLEEQALWYYVVDVEEPERQNWQTMLSVIDGKEIVVCNN